ncbi:hypothetical protein QQP08_006396 [Theobroma cacao]|nr:hypothetical protein QQP08_006396 [Theobroma cacao]
MANVQVQNSPCERKFGGANFSSTFFAMVFQTVIIEKLKKKQCLVALKVAPLPSSIIFVPRKQEVTLIFWEIPEHFPSNCSLKFPPSTSIGGTHQYNHKSSNKRSLQPFEGKKFPCLIMLLFGDFTSPKVNIFDQMNGRGCLCILGVAPESQVL